MFKFIQHTKCTECNREMPNARQRIRTAIDARRISLGKVLVCVAKTNTDETLFLVRNGVSCV